MFRLPSRAVRAALGTSLVVFGFVLPGPRPAAAAEGLGSVIIVQSTPSNPSQAFRYTSNVEEMATEFYLDQDPTTYPPATEASSWVTPGQYRVTQETHTGWKVASIECTDPEGEGTWGDASNRTATINMDADEEIVCTFMNVPATGDVNLHQTTVPQDPTVFHYITDFSSLDLADDGNEGGDGTWRDGGFGGITEGTYTLTQWPVPGYPVTDISCSDPDNGTTVDVGNGTVTLDIDADEVIDCTFVNGAPVPTTGNITINLDVVPDAAIDVPFSGSLGEFWLDDDADPSLPNGVDIPLVGTGTMSVFVDIPQGYVPVNLACADPDGGSTVDGQTLVIDLDASEAITCLVQIAPAPPAPPSGAVRITLDAVPNDPVDVVFGGSESPFSLDDDPADSTLDNQQDFWAHPVGSSTFVATIPTGFQLKDLTCTDPDSGTTVDKSTATATVDLDDDEEVNCTFTIEPKPVAPPAPVPQCNGLDATIVGNPGATTIRGTAGSDVIVDLDGANRIDGRGGDDTICTGNGDDVITGGTGNDVIFGGQGKNKIDGGDGADLLVGLAGNDTISGGAGPDWIYANDGANVVSGGAGDDHLRAGWGNDRIDGGRNFDTYVSDGGTDSVRNCEA